MGWREELLSFFLNRGKINPRYTGFWTFFSPPFKVPRSRLFYRFTRDCLNRAGDSTDLWRRKCCGSELPTAGGQEGWSQEEQTPSSKGSNGMLRTRLSLLVHRGIKSGLLTSCAIKRIFSIILIHRVTRELMFTKQFFCLYPIYYLLSIIYYLLSVI